ncbi:MAG TPA: hypothetical protein VFV99_18000 [Kofleriaceae bacterium]|nr:hypothetical protein [Kofleriaceae bacterium]
MRSATPAITTELAAIAREITHLRRRVLLLHAAVVTGGVAVLVRAFHGVSLTERSRFFAYWAAILVMSLVAFAISTRMRERLALLFARARFIEIRNRYGGE